MSNAVRIDGNWVRENGLLEQDSVGGVHNELWVTRRQDGRLEDEDGGLLSGEIDDTDHGVYITSTRGVWRFRASQAEAQRVGLLPPPAAEAE